MTIAEGGYASYVEATQMDRMERRALYYRAIQARGAAVDWATGSVTWPTPGRRS